MIQSVSLSLILFSLGAIHFHWAMGGKFGFEQALPTNENGEKVLNPGKIDSAIVGIILTAFGFFYLIRSGIINYSLPERLLQVAGWIIPFIFILRAIGDFRYVGFFKRITKTNFAKLDTRYFSPLCVIIGIIGIITQIIL